MTSPFRSLAIALAGTALPAAAQTVTIDTGTVHGRSAAGVETFLGIPYAAPPVGSLRWRAPQPAARWTGTREARTLGPDCVQATEPGDVRALSEDCLTVNVWRPAAKSARPRPVIVWIHGGGYVAGGSSDPQTWGESFARRGIILVTFNYRLGRLGFFAHPALLAEHVEEPKGNYGLLDQIAALTWVRRNIARFGGDPARVTAMGESAGGESVLLLAGSPMAAGLFQRAIVQSGGGRAFLLGQRALRGEGGKRVAADAAGLAFAKSVGVDGTDAAALARLRAEPATSINGGLSMRSLVFGGLDRFTGPIVDGRVLTAAPGDALAARRTGLPLLIGSTSADLGLNFSPSKDATFAAFGPAAGAARRAYDPNGTAPLQGVNDATASDKVMAEPARLVARTERAKGAPVWRFRFSYVAEAIRGKPISGAEHASDVAYAFDTLPAALKGRQSAGDQAVASAINGYWVNFAATGDPNRPGLPRWPKEPVVLDFATTGAPLAGADAWQARLDATEAMPRP